ncbi:hypothetical protein G6F56_011528 [Rhizopus delemar]|nr:hypothetical protein G6F56_011528 [Rhizopus delemar]
MDSKRRKAQDDLERRENEAKKAKMNQNQAKAEYEAELARLREEGAKRRQEDWNAESKQKQDELPEATELDCALKFKWKRKKYNFSERDLENMLEPLAKVDTVALSQKKKGSALVVFKTVVDAHGIIMKKDVHPTLYQFESIDWATGKVPALVERMHRAEELKKQAKAAYFNTNDRHTSASGKPLFATNSTHSFFKSNNIPSGKASSSIFDYDYESITLMKMRQAERDRVILLQSYEQAQKSTPEVIYTD